MEPWKVGIIGVLLLGLVSYGVSQQKTTKDPSSYVAAANNSAMAPAGGAAQPENKAATYIGQTLGADKLPAWSAQLGPWQNASAPVPLAALKGQPALVEFFRIGCSHCQEAAPFMEALYKRYQPRGLKMVAVQSPGNYKDATNEETQWPAVQNWIKAAGVTYPVAMDKDSKYFQNTIKGTFYPTTMIANSQGKVVYAQTGHDTEKAIRLALELEKQFPGSGTAKARAQSLAKFLQPFVPGTAAAAMMKSMTDDLEQRLLGKV